MIEIASSRHTFALLGLHRVITRLSFWNQGNGPHVDRRASGNLSWLFCFVSPHNYDILYDYICNRIQNYNNFNPF